MFAALTLQWLPEDHIPARPVYVKMRPVDSQYAARVYVQVHEEDDADWVVVNGWRRRGRVSLNLH